jgi:DNA-binding GntR family transcriptional regulator
MECLIEHKRHNSLFKKMAIKKNTKSPNRSKLDSESLSNQAYEKIEELIVTMTFEPGSPVSEAQLSTMLNIGRTPIREAMQRLSREHLVSILPKRGIFIADLDPQKQLRVLETRRELERLICKKAAKRANAAERKEFERIAKDFRKAQKEKNESLFLKVDKELNELTVIAAKNEYAGSAMASLHGMSRRFWFGNSQHIQNISDMAALHAAVAEAIAAGKDTEAGKALDRLVDYVEEFTKKTLISSE